MRRSVSVVIALLLATAAAAGAGDNIKWERSAEIAYIELARDGPAAGGDYDEEVKEYSIAWLPVVGKPEIDFIEATYYGWGLHCSRLKGGVADGKFSDWAFLYEVEKSKVDFRNFIFFYVTISARTQSDANLSNDTVWEIYLEWGDEKLSPVLIKADEDAAPTALVPYVIDAAIPPAKAVKRKFTAEVLKHVRAGEYCEPVRYLETYKIAFVNFYGEPPRGNLRLVIKAYKARCGFEWRFVEE